MTAPYRPPSRGLMAMYAHYPPIGTRVRPISGGPPMIVVDWLPADRVVVSWKALSPTPVERDYALSELARLPRLPKPKR